FVKRGLEEAQHVVDAVVSIAEADDFVSVQNYDLLIVDCMLPDGDGRHFCRELRGRGMAVPVLLLTAKAATTDKVAGLDRGADDFLAKPFGFIEPLARVRALGRRRGAVPSGQLAIADLQIDPQRHRVMRGGEINRLTPKEYLVLELLVSHAEKLLTR